MMSDVDYFTDIQHIDIVQLLISETDTDVMSRMMSSVPKKLFC